MSLTDNMSSTPRFGLGIKPKIDLSELSKLPLNDFFKTLKLHPLFYDPFLRDHYVHIGTMTGVKFQWKNVSIDVYAKFSDAKFQNGHGFAVQPTFRFGAMRFFGIEASGIAFSNEGAFPGVATLLFTFNFINLPYIFSVKI